MSKQSDSKRATFQFRVSMTELERFNEQAKREGTTLSELTRQLLEERAAKSQA
ncbi:hypothetical protein ACSMEA_05810 [Stenotrophomonas maltophilia]